MRAIILATLLICVSACHTQKTVETSSTSLSSEDYTEVITETSEKSTGVWQAIVISADSIHAVFTADSIKSNGSTIYNPQLTADVAKPKASKEGVTTSQEADSVNTGINNSGFERTNDNSSTNNDSVAVATPVQFGIILIVLVIAILCILLFILYLRRKRSKA